MRLTRYGMMQDGFSSRAAMPKEAKHKQQQMRTRIAAAAARIMAEDGVEDFALAKRKAARQLGAADTQALPNNEEIEFELRAYQSLYQGNEQRDRIRYLRSQALEAMRMLAQFRPYLSGSVLKGTAGRYSDIDLQVFTDDSKSVELFLLNRTIPYEVTQQRRFAGDQVRAVSVLKSGVGGRARQRRCLLRKRRARNPEIHPGGQADRAGGH